MWNLSLKTKQRVSNEHSYLTTIYLRLSFLISSHLLQRNEFIHKDFKYFSALFPLISPLLLNERFCVNNWLKLFSWFLFSFLYSLPKNLLFSRGLRLNFLLPPSDFGMFWNFLWMAISATTSGWTLEEIERTKLLAMEKFLGYFRVNAKEVLSLLGGVYAN